MKISLNWINEFVDLSGIDKRELIEKFTRSCAEVEEIYEYGKNLTGVIVAQIKSIEDVPNSTKLHKLMVDTGNGLVQVVCGAKNVKVGLKVAFAKLGANVNGFEIKKAILQGVESYGMCCSEQELGIAEQSDGILELPDTLPLGVDIKSIYDIDDVVFEIDNKSLTNRPDLWCHYGIAREIACLLKRELKPLNLFNLDNYDCLPIVNVKVESEDCFRYSAIKISNVTRKISPINMRIRLYYAGMRAINFLADLTNYIMLEVGQPMHAFDGEKVKSITVKNMNNFVFTTLDGEQRQIEKDTMMICANNTPCAIAGVMGGLDSEVEETTSSILLESANFDASKVRKTSQALSLRTESSERYEKCLDPELTTLAIKRFLEVLKQNDCNFKVTSNITDIYKKRYERVELKVSQDYVNKMIGVNIPLREMVDTLSRLGFMVRTNLGEMEIKVPSFRATKDISINADIVEEIARIYGYDNIVPMPVKDEILPVEQSREHLLEYDTKYLLATKYDFNEIHSYIFNNKKLNDELNIETKGVVKSLNSIVKENDEIRSELAPTLLSVCHSNLNAFENVKIFEIGRVVPSLKEKLCVEEKHLALLIMGKDEREVYFEVKKVLDDLAQNIFKVNYDLSVNTSKKSYLHPKNNAEILINNKKIGQLGLVHPKVLQNFGKNNVAILELDFSKFASVDPLKTNISEVTKYQSVSLDFNFLIDKNCLYKDIVGYLTKFQSGLQFVVKLTDIYNHESLGNKTSYTFNFTIFSYNHTLSGQEIEDFHKKLIAYANRNNFELR